MDERANDPAEVVGVGSVARAIANLRELERDLREELRAHRRLQEISSRLIPRHGIQELYEALVDAAIEVARAERGTMQTIDPETGDLLLLATRGIPEQLTAMSRRLSPDANTSCAVALRRGERVVVDYASDDRVAGTQEARDHLEVGIRAAQSTPLVARSGRVVGVLSTHWGEPHTPSDREEYLLDVLARQAADLIERAQAEHALREADRRKDEFLAVLAHELRNPLGPIRTAASLLPSVHGDRQRLQELSDLIERQSATMARLIDDLLDVSRITRGQIELRMERLDLAELVHETVEALRASCEEQGLEVSVELPDRPLPVTGDAVRIAQVLDNVLSNACKYTARGGRVRVTASSEDGDAVICVRDTGVGVAEDDLSRIFEMFAQVRGPSAEATGGLGIGLPLARSLLEMHGGTLRAASEGPGRGSEFTARLPLAAPEEVPHRERQVRQGAEAARSAGPRDPLRVLLVDDYPDALVPMQFLLEFKGHDVRVATSGEEALEIAEDYRPDVVVLDIGLPGIGGYEVADRLRADACGRDAVLIALTGWGQEKDKEQARRAGFDEHLTKPVPPRLLERLIRERVAERAASE